MVANTYKLPGVRIHDTLRTSVTSLDHQHDTSKKYKQPRSDMLQKEHAKREDRRDNIMTCTEIHVTSINDKWQTRYSIHGKLLTQGARFGRRSGYFKSGSDKIWAEWVRACVRACARACVCVTLLSSHFLAGWPSPNRMLSYVCIDVHHTSEHCPSAMQCQHSVLYKL